MMFFKQPNLKNAINNYFALPHDLGAQKQLLLSLTVLCTRKHDTNSQNELVNEYRRLALDPPINAVEMLESLKKLTQNCNPTQPTANALHALYHFMGGQEEPTNPKLQNSLQPLEK